MVGCVCVCKKQPSRCRPYITVMIFFERKVKAVSTRFRAKCGLMLPHAVFVSSPRWVSDPETLRGKNSALRFVWKKKKNKKKPKRKPQTGWYAGMMKLTSLWFDRMKAHLWINLLCPVCQIVHVSWDALWEKNKLVHRSEFLIRFYRVNIIKEGGCTRLALEIIQLPVQFAYRQKWDRDVARLYRKWTLRLKTEVYVQSSRVWLISYKERMKVGTCEKTLVAEEFGQENRMNLNESSN